MLREILNSVVRERKNVESSELGGGNDTYNKNKQV